jgi:hypothetical protein
MFLILLLYAIDGFVVVGRFVLILLLCVLILLCVSSYCHHTTTICVYPYCCSCRTLFSLFFLLKKYVSLRVATKDSLQDRTFLNFFSLPMCVALFYRKAYIILQNKNEYYIYIYIYINIFKKVVCFPLVFMLVDARFVFSS